MPFVPLRLNSFVSRFSLEDRNKQRTQKSSVVTIIQKQFSCRRNTIRVGHMYLRVCGALSACVCGADWIGRRREEDVSDECSRSLCAHVCERETYPWTPCSK